MKHEEDKLQAICVKWFRYQYPHILLFSVPNGGSRNIATAVNLKKTGVVSGIPDLFLAQPNNIYSGLFIEMKSEKGKLSENQINIASKLVLNNYNVVVCNSFESFKLAVEDYIRNN